MEIQEIGEEFILHTETTTTHEPQISISALMGIPHFSDYEGDRVFQQTTPAYFVG